MEVPSHRCHTPMASHRPADNHNKVNFAPPISAQTLRRYPDHPKTTVVDQIDKVHL
jgi:hypothetical protein